MFLLPIVVSANTEYSTTTVRDLIIQKSVISGIDTDLWLYVADHESSFKPNEIGDLDIKCKRTGKAIFARGVMQITRCYHPEISDEQAFDVEFSLNWAIPYLKDQKKCMSQFSTCRDYYNLLASKNSIIIAIH